MIIVGLLSQELSISCVVFFFLFKVQLVATRWLYLRASPSSLPQSSRWAVIWASSSAYGRAGDTPIWRRVLKRNPSGTARSPSPIDGVALPRCFRGAVVLAMSLSPRASPRRGHDLVASDLPLGIYFVLTLVCGRFAEMGLPVHEIERLGPTVLLGNVFGVITGQGEPGPRAELRWRACSSPQCGMRSSAFPHQVEGKCSWIVPESQSRLFKAMLGT